MLNINLNFSPELFLLNISEKEREKSNCRLIFYLTSTARMALAQFWKQPKTPDTVEWINKLFEAIEADKLATILCKQNAEKNLKRPEQCAQLYKTRMEYKIWLFLK